jgi:hypothetical protein
MTAKFHRHREAPQAPWRSSGEGAKELAMWRTAPHVGRTGLGLPGVSQPCQPSPKFESFEADIRVISVGWADFRLICVHVGIPKSFEM